MTMSKSCMNSQQKCNSSQSGGYTKAVYLNQARHFCPTLSSDADPRWLPRRMDDRPLKEPLNLADIESVASSPSPSSRLSSHLPVATVRIERAARHSTSLAASSPHCQRSLSDTPLKHNPTSRSRNDDGISHQAIRAEPCLRAASIRSCGSNTSEPEPLPIPEGNYLFSRG